MRKTPPTSGGGAAGRSAVGFKIDPPIVFSATFYTEASLLKVGLTGGIASGKSVVAGMFAQLGAQVIKADEIAHQLMQPGEGVYAEVVRHFGKGILNPDGTVNRPHLAEIAFGGVTGNQPSRVHELNRIVHPAVIEKQEQWLGAAGKTDPKAVANGELAAEELVTEFRPN